MQNPSLFLPGFHLAKCFTDFIPKQALEPRCSGAQSRRRLFSKENTFWGFFSQILNADGGCSEVVRKFHTFAASQSLARPSTSTSAYCQARLKLEEPDMESILAHTSKQIMKQRIGDRFEERRVIIANDTGISMLDTVENQEIWPQTL